MPTWTKSPPSDPRGHGLPLVRTPATRSLHAIVTSETLIGTDTHFWGGHTVPCERPECDACNAGVGYRWHGYLSAFNEEQRLHFLFEMTANAAHVFNDYFVVNKTLRCCSFEAYRWRHARNGRVIIKCEHSATPSHALPRAPELAKIMAIIWHLPAENVQPDGHRSGRPHLEISRDGDGQSSDLLDYLKPSA